MSSFITFSDMAAKVRDDLRVEFRDKLPFAVAVALTRTAVECRDRMKGHMAQVFDRPTPYALNAARAVPATPKTISSAVLLREFGGKGTPAERFLGPEIDGGPRRQKRSEKALSAAQFLQSGSYAVPGHDAQLDQYGNQARGQIVKIMSVLRAFGEQGYTANRGKGWNKKSRAGQIFAIRAGNNRGGLKPGVYQRTEGGGVKVLMRFVARAPEYKVRLPFDELVQADADKVFPSKLDQAVAEFIK